MNGVVLLIDIRMLCWNTSGVQLINFSTNSVVFGILDFVILGSG